MIVEKVLLLAKQTQVRAEKRVGRHKSDTKNTPKKNEMLLVTFAGSLYKTHAVLCSKIADVREIEVHDVRTWNLVIFGKLSDFYYTSRLSTQNGEIHLQKYPPISGKVSITKYLKQNAIDYLGRLSIENKLKVEKG